MKDFTLVKSKLNNKRLNAPKNNSNAVYISSKAKEESPQLQNITD